MKTARLLSAGLIGAALAVPAQAAGFYGSLYYQVQDVQLDDVSYYPQQWLVTGGWLSRYGIGPELQIGGGTRDDDENGFAIKTQQFRGVAARFQSPDEYGAHAWLSLGYGELQLNGSLDGESYPGNEWFTGPTVTLGVEFYLSDAVPGLAAGLSYSRWFLEDEMKNDNVGLGVSYAF